MIVVAAARRRQQFHPVGGLDNKMIDEAIRVLHPGGEAFEIRIIGAGKAGTVAGVFDDPVAAAAQVARYDGLVEACYITLNPLKATVAVTNRLEKNVFGAVNGEMIDRRSWLLFDFDPERLDPATGAPLFQRDPTTGEVAVDKHGNPKKLKCPSSAAELGAALALRDQVASYLTAAGWPPPLKAMSGNGGHLLYRVDLPNDAKSGALVAAVLKAAAARFGTEEVALDGAVYDPNRIVKVYGTTPNKGRASEDRPYRRSYLEDQVADLQPVALALLEDLVAIAPPKSAVETVAVETQGEAKDWERAAKGEGETIPFFDLETLKQRNPIAQVADDLGLQPVGKKTRNCPAHNDQGRPNLRVYDDNVFCFSCKFEADVIGLVEKVKNYKRGEAIRFLAARVGLQPTEERQRLPLIGDYRKSGLGNKNGDSKPKPYPKPGAQLPSTSPATVKPDRDLGFDAWVAADGRAWLPLDLWRDFETFAEADGYFDQVEAYHRRLGRDPDNGRYFVRGRDQVDHPDGHRRQSLRVEVFTALLAAGVKASGTPAGAWLSSEKGITATTQDRFDLVYLEDPRAAAAALVKDFGLDTLLDLGVYGLDKEKKPYFVFKRHRLLFPFRWKGEPVDCQGRNVEADAKGDRFRNTASRNPLPYNADDLVVAKTTGAPVFLCEGATDTIALAQSGRLAVGIVGTGGFKPAWLPYFEGLTVHIAFDADDPGQRAAAEVSKTFVAAGHRPPKVAKLPAGVKDVNQLFKEGIAK